MSAPSRPWIFSLLERWLGSGHGADMVRDLEGLWRERRRRGRIRAALWLWRQILDPHTVGLGWLLRRRARAGRRQNIGSISRSHTVRGAFGVLSQSTRDLARRPAFSITMLVTFALGIGATTAIYSVVDGVLIEPLPYPESDELVFIWGAIDGDQSVLLSGPQGREVSALEVFEGTAQIFGFVPSMMTRGDFPEPIHTLTVDHSFFDVLGVAPFMGQPFRPEQEFKLTNAQMRDPGFERPVQAVMLSHDFWRHQFGGDPDVLGQIFRIGGHRHEVVGVMPPGFRTELPAELEETTPADAWIMSPFDQPSFPRDTRFVRVVARLQAGASINDAQVALDRLAQWEREQFSEEARDNFRFRASSMQSEVGATAREPLLILLTAVGFVLLIACANVATLLLARASERSEDLRVRRALGASRGDLAFLGLAESIVVAAAGGVLGVMMAPAVIRLLVRMAPPELPRVHAIEVDGSVLAFAAGTTILVALIAGLLPAWRASRSTAVGSGPRTTASGHRRWTGRVLVTAEVSLTVVLVTGTGLLLRSLSNTFSVDPGFTAEGVYAWEADLTTPTHPTWESRIAYMRAIQDALGSELGIQSVGAMGPVPFDGADRVAVRIGSGEAAPTVEADLRRTGPGALEALQISPLEGRLLEWSDLEDFDQLHAVVDQPFAARAWPGESAVGRTIGVVRREYGTGSQVWDDWKRVVVVGVVPPVRGRDVRTADPPTVYVTYSQNMWGAVSFLARADGLLTAEQLRAAAAQADPRPLVRGFTSLEAVAEQRLAALRFSLTLIGFFALLGLSLSAVGVYGLLAHAVGQRERELHIRAALGATRVRLAGLVLASGLGLVAVGIAVGWAGSWWLTPFLESLLFGVSPGDPLTYVGVAVFLLAVALPACWIPSRRAGNAQPAAALR